MIENINENQIGDSQENRINYQFMKEKEVRIEYCFCLKLVKEFFYSLWK